MAQIITVLLPEAYTNSNEKIYHKINCDNGMTYYVRAEILSAEMLKLKENADIIQLIQISDFAINRKTNELIKCREPLENVVDEFLRAL